MKTVGFRSVVLYILLAVFLCGVGYLCAEFVIDGDRWAMQPYNGHIYGGDEGAELGEITDRNGERLAYTDENGQRLYGEGELNRIALLHTVGDPWGYISTSAEYTMRAKLSGYNFVTGLNPIPFSFWKNVKLTVDQAASAAAYSAMNGRNGAVLLYNYVTGEILVKVSAPGFDPEYPPEDIDENEAYNGVYLDNTLSSSFTPGSIFKLVTTLAAMEKWPDSYLEKTFTCYGAQEIGGSEITCVDGVPHGEQTLTEALGNSCNVYFANLALEIGARDLQKKAEELGFNRQLEFDGIPVSESEIDLSRAGANELGWAGVGQHTTIVNPYHMMVLMGAIAGDGRAVEPRITPGLPKTGENLMSAEDASDLKALMRSNVRDYYGDWNFPEGLEVCAKTGTGEVGEDKGPNCWIVGFCEDRDHPYAFAVLVEEGDGGMLSAGAVLSAMLENLS